MIESIPRTFRFRLTQTRTPNNGDPITSSVINQSLDWTQTRSGSSVPDWRAKINRPESATSSYSRYGVNVQPGFFSSVVGYKNPTTGYIERIAGSYTELLPGCLTSSKAYELALGNFLNDAGQQVSPFKGMVFLGELRETLRMLKRPASNLRNGISAYLNRARTMRRRYGARLATKGIAGMWLEYALGWQPLLGSIRDAAVAYGAYENEHKYYRAFGKGTSNAASTSASSNGLMGSKTYYLQDSNTVRTTTARIKGACTHRIDGVQSGRAEEIARLSGFTLAEFVPTIWELIPYSFVVDYFTNIGDILNATHGLTANWIWLSASREDKATLTSKRRLNPKLLKQVGLDFWSGGQTSPLVIEETSYTRWNPELRLPSLVLELPPLGFQWTTMLALLTRVINERGTTTGH